MGTTKEPIVITPQPGKFLGKNNKDQNGPGYSRSFLLVINMADILWLCNRQRCKDCFEECKYTTDKKYAVNPDADIKRFHKDPDGNLWEPEGE